MIKSKAMASAWTTCFQRCGVPRTFEVGDPGPSFIDVEPLRPKLAELDSDSCSSTRSFQDSKGRRWLVEILFSENRVLRLKDHNDELERQCRYYYKKAQERRAQGLPRSNNGT